MTEPERARFVQRRRNDLYAFAVSYPTFGALLFAIPGLLLALLVTACFWGLSFAVGDRAWAWLIPTLVVVASLVAIVFLGGYITLLKQCIERCRLPEDAVLRVFSLDSEQLHRCMVGAARPSRLESNPATLVILDIPEVGPAEIPVHDPDEGELRVSSDGSLRIAWSPLRRYLVEWIEVPESWLEGVKPVCDDMPQERLSLSWIPNLNRLYEQINEKPPACAEGSL